MCYKLSDYVEDTFFKLQSTWYIKKTNSFSDTAVESFNRLAMLKSSKIDKNLPWLGFQDPETVFHLN